MSTSSPQPVTLSDAESKGLQYPGAELPQPTPFDFLVAAMAASHDVDNARPQTLDEAIEEIADAGDWITRLHRPEALLENVASLVAACHRLADILTPQITETRLAQIIAENQP